MDVVSSATSAIAAKMGVERRSVSLSMVGKQLKDEREAVLKLTETAQAPFEAGRGGKINITA